MGTLVYFTWYYPVGLQNNASYTNSVTERGALTWLFLQVFMLFMSTFASATIACLDDPEVAAETANLILVMCLLFCG